MTLDDKQNSLSITQGSITKALLMFFVPVFGGTLLQLFYNTADTVIVGQFAGKQALAAVGGETTQLINLLTGFLTGVAGGAGVVLSHFYGAGDRDSLEKTVYTSVLTAIAGGILIALLGNIICEPLYRLTMTPEDVFPLSVSYTRIFFIGVIPSSVYNMCASLLRSSGDSKSPFYILAVSVTLNIVLDIVFTAVTHHGVQGVAWATFISQCVSAVCILLVFASGRGKISLKVKNNTFSPELFIRIMHTGLPQGVQAAFYCLSNIIIQWDINKFGTDTIAAWTSFCKIDAVFWCVTGAVGSAVTAIAGINYGAALKKRVEKCMWSGLFVSLFFTVICMIVFFFAGPFLISLFTSEQSVIDEACHMLNFFIPVWWTYVSVEILSGVIRATGRSTGPMVISLAGCCAFRFVWLYTAVPLCFSMDTVMACYPVSWIITSLMLWIYWFYIKRNVL